MKYAFALIVCFCSFIFATVYADEDQTTKQFCERNSNEYRSFLISNEPANNEVPDAISLFKLAPNSGSNDFKFIFEICLFRSGEDGSVKDGAKLKTGEFDAPLTLGCQKSPAALKSEIKAVDPNTVAEGCLKLLTIF